MKRITSGNSQTKRGMHPFSTSPRQLLAWGALLVVATGCFSSRAPTAADTNTSWLHCDVDDDCRGDRLCMAGLCEPTELAGPPEDPPEEQIGGIAAAPADCPSGMMPSPSDPERCVCPPDLMPNPSDPETCMPPPPADASPADCSGADTGGDTFEAMQAMVTMRCGVCHRRSQAPRSAGLQLTGDSSTERALDFMDLVIRPSCETTMPLVDLGGGDAALNNSWLYWKVAGFTQGDGGTLAPFPGWTTTGHDCGQDTLGPFGSLMPLGVESPVGPVVEAVRNWICAGAPGPAEPTAVN